MGLVDVEKFEKNDHQKRAYEVTQACKELCSLSQNHELQAHSHGQRKHRLQTLLEWIAAEDIAPNVRAIAVSVPYVSISSLVHALNDSAFQVRLQAFTTLVRTWSPERLSVWQGLQVLHAIAMDPDVENIVKMIGILQESLSNFLSETVRLCFEQKSSKSNPTDFSSDAVLSLVTLLTEHESDKVRSACARVLSIIAQLNFRGIDGSHLQVILERILRNLVCDTSTIVVRAAATTLLTLARGQKETNGDGIERTMTMIDSDQILSLLRLHGGTAGDFITNMGDAKLAVSVLQESLCSTFHGYCLLISFFQRRLFQRDKVCDCMDDWVEMWTNCLEIKANRQPQFDCIYKIGHACDFELN